MIDFVTKKTVIKIYVNINKKKKTVAFKISNCLTALNWQH